MIQLGLFGENIPKKWMLARLASIWFEVSAILGYPQTFLPLLINDQSKQQWNYKELTMLL